jgi:hypothetical protein
MDLGYEFGEGVTQNVPVAYALYELADMSSDKQPDLPNLIRLSPHARTGSEPEIMQLEQRLAKPAASCGGPARLRNTSCSVALWV